MSLERDTKNYYSIIQGVIIMKQYTAPELEIVRFAAMDVITMSGVELPVEPIDIVEDQP